jgi:hypothetical protein
MQTDHKRKPIEQLNLLNPLNPEADPIKVQTTPKATIRRLFFIEEVA